MAGLESRLAAHIAAAPVFMRNTRAWSASVWRRWLSEPSHFVFLAHLDDAAVGYIKAQEPQADVNYAVHADTTLAINGMYVDPCCRSQGVGRALLAALAGYAVSTGKDMVSVDCETANLEAYAFWTRWFHVVTWSLERRV